MIYKDASLPVEQRVGDLLSRMTLEEKARQLDQYAGTDIVHGAGDPHAVQREVDYEKLAEVCGDIGFGVIQNRYSNAEINNLLQKYVLEHTRLGIPILFAEEGLHGFFKHGCTVFPQQIMLAGTFMPELAEEVGHAIAAEASALGTHEVWAPVLDLARDPRWGRTEEGYGEDTYLGSRFAARFVKGMQGDDVTADDRVISEPKHFSGYGAPIGGLNCMPCAMGKHEHHMFALPIFEAAYTEGGAINAMCSYSSIDGIPCASDRDLMTGVLRDQWGMQGFVRSDMSAIAMLNSGHNVADSREEAIRMALEAGVDVQLYDFPHDFYQETIVELVKSGKLKLEVLDGAVARVLRVKFMLGLFENPYTKTGLEVCIHSEPHQKVALEVARKGICLLKNSGLLPLKKDIGNIAVIGPSADDAAMGDYTIPPKDYKPITLLQGIKDIVSPQTTVTYAMGCHHLDHEVMPIPVKWLRTPGGAWGLKAEYFNNPNEPTGTPALTRIDRQIDFNWIYYKPADCIDANFSVRWTGKLVPDATFDAYIGLSSMDSMRLWLDGTLLIDGWDGQSASQMEAFHFEQGREHDIRIEYRNDNRGARVVFGWNRGDDLFDEAVALAKQADAVIVSLGDSHETSGENFDRSDLNLPGRQLELLKVLHETGTPVILVLQSGRPMTLTWETSHIPAIVEAWFPGEKGGQAIAEVLFGDINPAGRLPVSFPRSIGQLPMYYNRKAAGGKKYIEMDWLPLIPFGFGLSYTYFAYENLSFSAEEIHSDETLTVSFDVINTGDRAGEEVPQLYIRDYHSSVVRPVCELRGFTRISLEPGERRRVEMKLGPYELRTLTPAFEWVVEPGKVGVMVGPNSMDLRLRHDFYIKD